jgi:hypothetical protein
MSNLPSSRVIVLSLSLALSQLLGAGALRADDPALVCETLAARAGAEAGLPAGLMPAIARVESGHGTAEGRRAWPWTLNEGGKGSYHPSREAALSHLKQVLAGGTRNVDLGCMQLNWHWHGAAFADAAAMIDPVANTRYAAQFLRDLHDRHGSWTQAVAHYHSRNPARGAVYAAKVAQTLGEIEAELPVAAAVAAPCALADAPHASLSGAAALPAGCSRRRGLLVIGAGALVQAAPARDLRLAQTQHAD